MLQGKTALVSGAASGIGEAIARLFAENGAKVVLTDIDTDAGKKIVAEIKKAGGKAIFLKADASKPKDNEKAVKKAIDKYGSLDVAVNNAGIGGPQAPVGEYEIEAWQQVIGLNLSGVFYGMRYQIPQMAKQKSGVILNMASVLGQAGTQGSPAYVAAKHGVVGLTKAAALEYATAGIRVNAIGPGYIKTPLLTENLSKKQLKQIEALHPIGRLGEAEEIAELALWLASDKASFVTGAYYNADGGYLAQ